MTITQKITLDMSYLAEMLTELSDTSCEMISANYNLR